MSRRVVITGLGTVNPFGNNVETPWDNVKKGDTEGFANLPLNIKGIIFSVFIREDNDFIKISFRSQGDFPSNQFASKCFNGGGHLNAAGGEFYGTMDEAIAIFEKALPEFGDLLKKNNILTK